ncbi:YsnF/AvaK domain-containing protein [Dyadobacter luticola]|uniref:DUF2382 domain-containing protein n=1 Tax=Dyadobacter luticola TaxID=1979387 RepID=A0A5R9KZ98_9BACT|nr:YsnF/AvaK domain-containing protein [Dyadobacter luticola]TLV01511.1 DUF2382 domain-containing protein [Dyadobacter luticola]
MEGQDNERINDGFPIEESRVIPVIQEKLVVTNERVETGKVVISKQVFEEEDFIDVTATRDEVVVERKPINQYVESAPPAVRQEGDVTIVSVMKEVLVVEKRLMLVEELHITKRQHQDQQTYSEILKKEEITINRETSGTDI